MIKTLTFTLMLIVCTSSVAVAQKANNNDLQAQAALATGNVDRAIALWMDSLKSDVKPETFFLLALAHEQKDPAAVVAFAEAAHAHPDATPSLRAQVELLLTRLQVDAQPTTAEDAEQLPDAIDQENVDDEPDAMPESAPVVTSDGESITTEDGTVVVTEVDPVIRDTPAEMRTIRHHDTEPESPWTWQLGVGTAAVGIGVISLISAAFIDARLSSDLDRLEVLRESNDTERADTLEDSISGRQDAGQAFLWTGVVFSLGGGILLATEFLDLKAMFGFYVDDSSANVNATVSF